MAICSLNKNLKKDEGCGYVLQSVTKVYLANASGAKFAEQADEDGHISVSGVTLATGATWYEIEPAKNTASFTDVLNVTDSGNKYRTHTLSFSVTGIYSEDMEKAVDGLSLGSYIAIAQFASGDAVLLGSPSAGLEATVVTNTGSASAGEASGISVEMTADLTNSAYAIPKDEIEAFLGKGE